MARVRVTAATLKRLEAVERSFDEDDGPAGGVMKVPAILGLDAWERIAMPQLAALAAAAAEDVEQHRADTVEPFKHDMPAAVVSAPRTHTPNPNRPQAAVPKRPPMPPTVTR